MQKNVGKVLKNSTIYVIGNLALKAFNILVIPIYTHYLSTAEYGQTSILNNFTNVMIYIIGMSLYSAVMRFYTDYKDDSEKVKIYFSTIIWFILGSGVFFAILLCLSKNTLMKYVFGEIEFNPTVMLCIISLVFCCAYTMYQSVLRSLEKAFKYIVISSIYLILNCISLILFVIWLRLGATGVMIAQLSAYFISTVIMVIDLFVTGYFGFKFNIKMLKDSLKYSIPLIPHNLSAQITQLISKVFIQSKKSYSELGIYNLSSQFGMISDLVQNSVSMAIQPWFYSLLKEREGSWQRDLNRLIKTILVGYFIVFTGLSIFSQEVICIVASETYYEAWKVIPFVVLTYAIKVPYYFYINTLFYYKKASKYIFTATLSSSVLNAFLSYFFIEWWGMYGSILADAIAMLIRVGIVLYLSLKVENIGIEISTFVKTYGLTLLFSFLGTAVGLLYESDGLNILRLIIKTVVYFVAVNSCMYTFKIRFRDIKDKIKILRSKN